MRIPGKLYFVGRCVIIFPHSTFVKTKPGMLIGDFKSLGPSLQIKWQPGEIWVCKAFPFASPTEIGHSQIWPPLQDYRWKTEGNNGLWKYFAVQKLSFL